MSCKRLRANLAHSKSRGCLDLFNPSIIHVPAQPQVWNPSFLFLGSCRLWSLFLVPFRNSDYLLEDSKGMLTYFARCSGGIALCEGSREEEMNQ